MIHVTSEPGVFLLAGERFFFGESAEINLELEDEHFFLLGLTLSLFGMPHSWPFSLLSSSLSAASCFCGSIVSTVAWQMILCGVGGD